jgi:hypothetical protein
MREVLVIFRKDVRRMRIELAVWVLLMGIYSCMEAVLPERPGWLGAVEIWEWLLAPAAWYLTLAAIHEELLPGDCQYWLTKPIPRSNLLTAKLLFVVVFLNLPLALSQTLALQANGLPLRDFGGNLVWRQLVFTPLLLMPVAALAAVTATFGQFAVALLCGYSAVLLLGFGTATMAQDLRWGGISWILTAVVAALALVISGAVLLLAYLRRLIGLSRWILVAGVLVCGLLPAFSLWRLAFAVQDLLSTRQLTAAGVRLAFDAARDPAVGRGILARADTQYVRVAIPITLTGIRADTHFLSERIKTSIDGAGGSSWRSGWSATSKTLPLRDGWWQYVEIERSFFDSLRHSNVHLHTRTAFTLFGSAHVSQLSVPADNRFVPDVGFCWVSPARVLCFSPFRHSARMEIASRPCQGGDLRNLGMRPEVSYAPYSGAFGFGLWKTDIDMTFFPPTRSSSGLAEGGVGCEVVFETSEALTHLERDLDIPSIRLVLYRDLPGAVP